jgi:phosphatidylglycerophosphate synthase
MDAAPATAERVTHRALVARLGGAQKGAKGAPAYSRFINRRAGRHLAAVAYRANLSPNQVTAISAVFSAAGIAALALLRPSLASGVVVTALLLFGYALDSADGQLARLRGASSTAGEWLDHMIDSAKISALHCAVLVNLYRFFDLHSAGYLLVPLGFCIVAAVHFFATIFNEQLRRIHGRTTRSDSGGARPSVLRSLLVAPTDYGVECLSFLLLGWRYGFLVAYAALFAANALYLLLATVKWFREMVALDAT